MKNKSLEAVFHLAGVSGAAPLPPQIDFALPTFPGD